MDKQLPEENTFSSNQLPFLLSPALDFQTVLHILQKIFHLQQ